MFIPVYYVGVAVGMAVVDEALDGLSTSLVWRLEVPRTIRRLASGRQDILVATLREDETKLQRCHPYCWITSTFPLRLSRVALCPDLVDTINILSAGNDNEQALADLRTITKSIRRVVYLDGNRLNCTTANIREVQ